MRNWLPKIALLLTLVMLTTGIVLALDEPEEPVAAQEVVKKVEVPPVADIVTRYAEIMEASGLAVGYRPTITGKDFVAAGPNHAVVQVIYDVFQRGGNIWDAAAAGMWMTEVLGGQMTPGTAPFTMWVAEEGKAKSYCGVGNAPALGTIDYLINKWGDSIKSPAGFYYVPNTPVSQQGPDAQFDRANVAASPDNIFALLIRYGTMSFTECFQEVLDLMENGWPMRTKDADFIIRGNIFSEPKLSDPNFSANRLHWAQNGRDAQPGDLLKEHGLTRTIKAMMRVEQVALALGATREDALQAARDWYYTGPIAEAIDKIMRENDGMLRYEDYADYTGFWSEQEDLPQTNFMGVDFYTDPTYTQAGVLVLVLNILDNFDLASLGFNTPEYLHVITQAFDLAFSDRWQYFGDPHFYKMPENLWSKKYGTLRAGLIDMKMRFQEAPPPGDPANMKAVLEGWEPWVTPAEAAIAWEGFDMSTMVADLPVADENIEDTIFMNIIDKEGNVFSYCPSDGRNSDASQISGWGVGIPRRGRQFTLDPDLPSSIAPGKRPVSTPHTWVASKDGVGYMVAQSPGGDQQIQSALPMILNTLIWGMPAQVAVDQPRVATHNLYSMFTPYIQGRYRPGTTEVDAELPEETIKGLEALGHIIRMGPRWAVGSTPLLIVRDPLTGLIHGGASVRSEGYCFGR